MPKIAVEPLGKSGGFAAAAAGGGGGGGGGSVVATLQRFQALGQCTYT